MWLVAVNWNMIMHIRSISTTFKPSSYVSFRRPSEANSKDLQQEACFNRVVRTREKASNAKMKAQERISPRRIGLTTCLSIPWDMKKDEMRFLGLSGAFLVLNKYGMSVMKMSGLLETGANSVKNSETVTYRAMTGRFDIYDSAWSLWIGLKGVMIRNNQLFFVSLRAIC